MDYTLSRESVENGIRKAIIKGEYPPGSKLTQDQLAKQFKVSRMPIREALKKLESEGLITFEANKGAFVRELTEESVKENYELRSELETLALLKSFPHLKEIDYERMDELIKSMEETDDPELFVEQNIKFHRVLIERCPWQRLKSFVLTLWDGYPQQTPNFLQDQMKKSNKDHFKIAFALKNDCPEVAADLLSKHISETGERLVKYMKNEF